MENEQEVDEEDLEDSEEDLKEDLKEDEEGEESEEPLEEIIEETPAANYPTATNRWPGSPSLETRPIQQSTSFPLETELEDVSSDQAQREEESKIYSAEKYNTETYQSIGPEAAYPEEVSPQVSNLTSISQKFIASPNQFVNPEEIGRADEWQTQRFKPKKEDISYKGKLEQSKRNRRRL